MPKGGLLIIAIIVRIILIILLSIQIIAFGLFRLLLLDDWILVIIACYLTSPESFETVDIN